MKIEKWREMTRTDLDHKLKELRDSMLKTKVKVMTKQVENTAQISATRRDIARILTLFKEMDKAGTKIAAAPKKTEAKATAAKK
jgi:ribosomal protein L29